MPLQWRCRGYEQLFLNEKAERLGLKQLSMGMSGDFAKAILFGATYVRVGTAIFGADDYAATIAAMRAELDRACAGATAGAEP